MVRTRSRSTDSLGSSSSSNNNNKKRSDAITTGRTRSQSIDSSIGNSKKSVGGTRNSRGRTAQTENQEDAQLEQQQLQNQDSDDVGTPLTPTRKTRSTTRSKSPSSRKEKKKDSTKKPSVDDREQKGRRSRSNSDTSNSRSSSKKRRQKIRQQEETEDKDDVSMDIDNEEQHQDNNREDQNENVLDKDYQQKQKQKHKTNNKEKKNEQFIKYAKQNTPTLDVHVHRLRHLQYHPKPIIAMAATPTNGYVAIARQDGSYQLKVMTVLEEYADQYIPHLITVSEIPPPTTITTNTIANSVCWVSTSEKEKLSTPVCIGASPSGNIWIIDFQQSKMISYIHSNGGGVFDLTSCAASTLPLVAAACQDGSVRIWKINNHNNNNNNNIQIRPSIQDPPIVTVPSMGAPILSLAWRCICQQPHQTDNRNEESPSSSSKDMLYQTVLFAAVADGTIRKYQIDLSSTVFDAVPQSEYYVQNVKSMHRMTVESKGRRIATKVWSMQLLQDDTLIAGNSLGQVQFWNGQTGTLQQSVLQTSLQADVLKVVVNQQETKVFCSGVDSRVVCIERVSNSVGSPWRLTHVQRPHTHDVKAMVIVSGENNEVDNHGRIVPRRLETLITGGVDTKICSYLVSAFGEKRPHLWYPWPMASPISTSMNAHSSALLSMQRNDRIELYQLERTDKTNASGEKDKDKPSGHEFRKESVKKLESSNLVGTIRLDDGSNGSRYRLMTSKLSQNGHFLAVSNGITVLVFYLEQIEAQEQNVGEEGSIKPIKLKIPEDLQHVNATALQFWGNILYVADSTKRHIHVVHLRTPRMGTNQEIENNEISEMSYTTVRLPNTQQRNREEIDLPVHALHVSRNGEYLVSSSHVRDHGIHIFRKIKDGNREIYRHHWTIPELGGNEARPAALTTIQKNMLAVATYQSHLYVFDIAEKKLNRWSERNGFPIEYKGWTEDLLSRKDFPVRLMTNPRNKWQLIMSSFGTFCMVDLSEKMPSKCRIVPEKHIRRRRHRQSSPENEDHDPWLQPRISEAVSDDDDDDGKNIKNKNVERKGRGEDGADGDARPKRGKKRKLEKLNKEGEMAKSCTICLLYNGMLYMDFVSRKEIVVVEQPWLEVVATFPDPLQRRIYGCN